MKEAPRATGVLATDFQPSPYPGQIPPYSFCIEQGRVRRLDPSPHGDDYRLESGQTLSSWLTGQSTARIAVLTYGSNACPGRLAQKFPNTSGSGFVLLQGTLAGAIPVWSSNTSSVGSVPLTLAHAPGHHRPAHLMLIPEADAAAMDRSEGRGGPFYALARLDECEFVASNGTVWRRPLAYVGHSERGPLLRGGRPVSDLEANQSEAQTLVGDAAAGQLPAMGDTFLPVMTVVDERVPLARAVSDPWDRPLRRWLGNAAPQ